MKWIHYKFLSAEINRGTEEQPLVEQFFVEKALPYSKTSEEIAKREAYNGEYAMEDDGQPESEAIPNQLDAIEAQVTYTAMMTDTLLEV